MSSASSSERLESLRGRAVDIDHHYYEPLDCFSRHIEPAFRDQAIHAIGDYGQHQWVLGDRASTYTPAGLLTDIMGRPGAIAGTLSGNAEASIETIMAEFAIMISDYPEWREDRAARLKQMDDQGLRAVFMLPSNAVVLYSDFTDLPQALNANFRSFNRWLEEAWGYGDCDRIVSVPVVSLLDVDWAIEELERVAGLGSRFVWMPHTPVDGRSPADPCFDPFWARLEALGLKLVYHIGFEGFTKSYGPVWGEPHRYITDYSAFQHYLCFGDRPIMDTFASLILNNLFGRFPGIEVVTIENGSAWVAPLMKALDKAAMLGRNGPWAGGKLEDLPSDIFRAHVHVNPYHEEDIPGLIETMGADRVLFGSDFPHPEGLANPLDFAASLVDQVSAEDFERIMAGNAAQLLGL